MTKIPALIWFTFSRRKQKTKILLYQILTQRCQMGSATCQSKASKSRSGWNCKFGNQLHTYLKVLRFKVFKAMRLDLTLGIYVSAKL